MLDDQLVSTCPLSDRDISCRERSNLQPFSSFSLASTLFLRKVVVGPFGHDVELQLMRKLHDEGRCRCRLDRDVAGCSELLSEWTVNGLVVGCLFFFVQGAGSDRGGGRGGEEKGGERGGGGERRGKEKESEEARRKGQRVQGWKMKTKKEKKKEKKKGRNNGCTPTTRPFFFGSETHLIVRCSSPLLLTETSLNASTWSRVICDNDQSGTQITHAQPPCASSAHVPPRLTAMGGPSGLTRRCSC